MKRLPKYHFATSGKFDQALGGQTTFRVDKLPTPNLRPAACGSNFGSITLRLRKVLASSRLWVKRFGNVL